MCSSGVLLKMSKSSTYASAYSPMPPSLMVASMTRWNFALEFLAPMGMRVYIHSSFPHQNANFSWSSGATGIWWNPALRSIFVKMRAPFTWQNRSSGSGMLYLSASVRAFRSLKSTQKRRSTQVPSASFLAGVTGEAAYLWAVSGARAIMPAAAISEHFSSVISCSRGERLLKGLKMFLSVSSVTVAAPSVPLYPGMSATAYAKHPCCLHCSSMHSKCTWAAPFMSRWCPRYHPLTGSFTCVSCEMGSDTPSGMLVRTTLSHRADATMLVTSTLYTGILCTGVASLSSAHPAAARYAVAAHALISSSSCQKCDHWRTSRMWGLGGLPTCRLCALFFSLTPSAFFTNRRHVPLLHS